MSAPKSPPPVLPGFDFLEGLGGGGFADVFKYQQRRPSRQVAIKVLRHEHLSDALLRQFDIEADLMAEVSDHPHIVTIHAIDLAPDGRPFLVMEYCPPPHFDQRARGGAMPIAEVLKVGVQVASAVAAAHHAKILHRDIKPANILTSRSGVPALTDFGIAGGVLGAEAAIGVSYGYSAPEVVEDPVFPGSIASDVYSLGATIYNLLVGRSPHRIPNGDNSDAALIARILRSAPPPTTGRKDVPTALEGLLAQALSRDPDGRPSSADSFARALQDVEQSLHLSPTPIPVMEAHRVDAEPRRVTRSAEDADHTQQAKVTVVDAWAPAEPSATPARHATSGAYRTSAAAGGAADPATVLRDGRRNRMPDAVPSQEGPERVALAPSTLERESRKGLILGIAGATVVLVVLVAVIVSRRSPLGPVVAEQPTRSPGAAALAPVDIAPDPPERAKASLSAEGTLVLTIATPRNATPAGLDYVIVRNDDGAWPTSESRARSGRIVVTAAETEDTEVTVSGVSASDPVCVEVFAKRGSLLSSGSAATCASAAGPATSVVP